MKYCCSAETCFLHYNCIRHMINWMIDNIGVELSGWLIALIYLVSFLIVWFSWRRLKSPLKKSNFKIIQKIVIAQWRLHNGVFLHIPINRKLLIILEEIIFAVDIWDKQVSDDIWYLLVNKHCEGDIFSRLPNSNTQLKKFNCVDPPHPPNQLNIPVIFVSMTLAFAI